MLATGLVLLDAFILERIFFKIKRYKLRQPQGKEPIKLVHLTDLHFRHNYGLQHRLLIRKLNELCPDLIMISGDIIDQSGELKPFNKFLEQLDHKILKIAVAGNHDYKADIDLDDLRKQIEDHNGHLLFNESFVTSINGQRVVITGLDDYIEGKPDIERAFQNIGKEENHFVLLHNPLHHEKVIKFLNEHNEKAESQEQLNVYAFFAGHNHGGQITIGPYVPHLPDKSGDYVKGWYHEHKPFLYLSKGFGTSTLPIRFFARAEMTLLDYNAPE